MSIITRLTLIVTNKKLCINSREKCENTVKYNKAAKKEEEKYCVCGADCYFVLSYIHRKKWVDFSHKDVTSDK